MGYNHYILIPKSELAGKIQPYFTDKAFTGCYLIGSALPSDVLGGRYIVSNKDLLLCDRTGSNGQTNFDKQFEDVVEKYDIVSASDMILVSEMLNIFPDAPEAVTVYSEIIASLKDRCGLTLDEIADGMKSIGFISEGGETYRAKEISPRDEIIFESYKRAIDALRNG